MPITPKTGSLFHAETQTYVAFSDIEKARAFERYLKSGSGHAFAKKRLW
jgi:putative endonuclease